MMSRSGLLKPNAVAGGPSVTKLTHSSCTGIRPCRRACVCVWWWGGRRNRLANVGQDKNCKEKEIGKSSNGYRASVSSKLA
jgi:hypothetical protein